ncbi:MAG: arsenate reductase (glutaredoxin) [Aquificaceae bacterium]|nr:MAG: arsenate reductase (glutaredoxin) [Aquificaceae bacterium]
MSESTIIYHNPRCSKSRQTLELLTEKEEPLEVVKYLDTPPSKETLEMVLDYLGLAPRQLMRTWEAPYKALNLADESLSRDDLIAAMLENPILIERPIVIKKGKVAIGRPPESVIDIL